MKLYEIPHALSAALNKWEDASSPEDKEEAEREYLALDLAVEKKIDGSIKYLKGQRAFLEALKEEHKNLYAKACALTRKIEWLERLIGYAVGVGNKFSSPSCQLYWHKSEAVDEEKLTMGWVEEHPEYVRIKTTKEIDKAAILRDRPEGAPIKIIRTPVIK